MAALPNRPDQPTLETLLDASQVPSGVFLASDPHVRPGPEQTPVVVVVLGKIIGEHLAIQSINRVQVGATRAISRDAFLPDYPVIVDENRLGPFPEP